MLIVAIVRCKPPHLKHSNDGEKRHEEETEDKDEC